MANLTGMPISSLPETTLQEGDQVVGYRAETGKAYRTDLADQIADLTEQVNQLNQSLSNFNVKSSTVASGASADFSYNTVCLIFVARGSTSTTYNSWFCDQWNGVVALSGNSPSLSVTVSNKVATLTNNFSSYVNYIVFAM